MDSNVAFLAVPIVGGMFIDFFNAAIINTFINTMVIVIKLNNYWEEKCTIKILV